MLWTIFIILLVLWLLGFIGHVEGAFIPPTSRNRRDWIVCD